MRRAIFLLLVLTAVGALAGCGDSENTSDATVTSTNAAAPAATTTTGAAPAATESGGAPAGKAGKAGKDSDYVVVTSLLGKQLPKEPRCRFAKNFVPEKPAPASYDGALTLTVTCEKSAGYRGMGQIVNRPGSRPTEITCQDTSGGQLYCIYVPNPSVGL